MLNGRFRGKDIGSGTDVFRFVDDVRAGVMSIEDFVAAESAMARSPSHCMTMGTASTMASMAESLGVARPGNAAYPAVDAHRARLARMTGRRAVPMVNEDQCLSKILTKENPVPGESHEPVSSAWPLCAVATTLSCQPPTNWFTTPPRFNTVCPLPKGNV